MNADMLHLLGGRADTLRAQADDEEERELFKVRNLSRY